MSLMWLRHIYRGRVRLTQVENGISYRQARSRPRLPEALLPNTIQHVRVEPRQRDKVENLLNQKTHRDIHLSSTYLWTFIPAIIVCLGISFVSEETDPLQRTLSYVPLAEGPASIRLLILRPGTGSRRLECNLVSTTFSTNPTYEALSYVWGEHTSSEPIYVNGCPVIVQQSVYSALENLRHAKEARVLWIDSLCINQTDLEEKNSQIQLMGFIYRRASQVIIWLGNHDSTAFGWPWSRLLRLRFPEASNDERVANIAHHTNFPFDKIINDPYWKRVWIIQEVVLASKITVHYGRDALPWETFVSLMRLYQQLKPNDQTVDGILALEQLRRSKGVDANIFQLRSLIETFKDSFCSERHDKIYAFLALATDYYSDDFPVDYRKPISQLYEDVISLFCAAPDASFIETSATLLYYSALLRRVLSRKIILFPGEPSRPAQWHWQASEEENSRDWHVAGDRSFTVRGVVAGSITYVGRSKDEWATSGREGPLLTPITLHERAEDLKCALPELLSGSSKTQIKHMVNLQPLIDIDWQDGFNDDPHVFVGTQEIVGLAPTNAQEGDLIVRFWNCSSCAVVRRYFHTERWFGLLEVEVPSYVVIGRAVLVKDEDGIDWDILVDDDVFDKKSDNCIDLEVKLDTLTKLSLDIVRLPGTRPE